MTDTSNPAPSIPPDFYEKTLRNLADLRRMYGLTLPPNVLGDAEAAIANLIVLEAEATKERDCLRADLETAQGRLRYERDEMRTNLRALPYETIQVAALRLGRERDEVRAERDRALAAALEARSEIEDWRTRFDALATRAADLVKERDEARASVTTERAPTPFKVGDLVYNMATNEAGIVFGHFESIEGVRFVAVVETKWGRSFFWSLDLVEAVKS